MERETQKTTLPFSKLELEYFTYVKAKEMLGLAKAADGTRYLLETLIVSLGGSRENVYDQIMELRVEDYKAINDALYKLVETLTEKKG